MSKWIQKNRYFIIGVVIILLGIGTLAIVERQRIMEKTTESMLENPPRSNEVLTSTFYYDQLNKKERIAFELLKSHMEEKKGGVVTFPETLTGIEFARVCNALEYDSADYFYGFVDIPMNSDNRYLAYDKEIKNIAEIKTPQVDKCILFLYSSEGINEKGVYDEKGYVTNIEEIQKVLSINNEGRLAEIEKINQSVNEKLDQAMAALPEEYGQKETVDYFLDWIKSNLKYDAEEYQNLSQVTTMTGLFEQCYIRSNTASLAEGKALAAGYAKVLMALCNRAGMESHVIFGVWNKVEEGYVITSVKLGEEAVYVDAAGIYAEGLYGLAGQRYLREAEFLNRLAAVEYFEYK